jgi:hydrogenase expression/formation protein HypD
VKHLEEYRDATLVHAIAAQIRERVTCPWTLMEVCGGQTHSIVRHGLDEMLPPEVTLIHGPGCPVCVTPISVIDHAIALTRHPEVILATFGDMVRVPGRDGDLARARAQGGDVRVVMGPLDAVTLAERNPERTVVFLAVGFETTAPVNALAVLEAERRELLNFTLLAAHVLVPPAMEAILSGPGNRVQGFLAAGHVCTITGTHPYHAIARKHQVPIVVTGFEPVDILAGIEACVTQLEAGRAEVENAYARAVRPEGNATALRAMDRVFEVANQSWRGLGTIPRSGLRIRPAYARFDAARRYPEPARSPGTGEAGDPDGVGQNHPESVCVAGEILTGVRRPSECPAFGTACTPEMPLGAPMVSAEGACSAYFRYRRTR